MGEGGAALPIRPGMDVYSVYQDQYLGAVVRVHVSREGKVDAGAGSGPEQSGTSSDATANPELVQEEGASISPTYYEGKRTLGEEMGPVPTIADGNRGPIAQSALGHYATAVSQTQRCVLSFAIRPGRPGHVNPLARPLYIPISAVQSISMDRIVLDRQRESIPEEWRHRPR